MGVLDCSCLFFTAWLWLIYEFLANFSCLKMWAYLILAVFTSNFLQFLSFFFFMNKFRFLCFLCSNFAMKCSLLCKFSVILFWCFSWGECLKMCNGKKKEIYSSYRLKTSILKLTVGNFFFFLDEIKILEGLMTSFF